MSDDQSDASRAHDRRTILQYLGAGATGTALVSGTSSGRSSSKAGELSCATGPYTRRIQPAIKEASTASSGTLAAELSAEEIADLAVEAESEQRLGKLATEKRDVARPQSAVGSTERTDTQSVSSARQEIDILTEFDGIVDPFVVPSDANLAVGPDEIMVTINTLWAIFGKDGTLRRTFDLKSWFSNVIPDPDAGFVTDPWVRYDPDAGRFYHVVAFYNEGVEDGLLALSVSDNSDPTGRWYNYALRPVASNGLVEFPALGFDSEAVYVTENFFEPVGEGFQFDQATVTILDKSRLGVGAPVTAASFRDLRNPDGTRAFTVRPADQPFLQAGADERRPYFMLNSKFGFGDSLTLWSLRHPLSDPTISCQRVSTPRYFLAPFSEQPNTDVRLDTGDTRLLTVVFDEFDDTLWTAHTVGQDWNGDGSFVSAIQWLEVDPFEAQLDQQGRWGEAGTHYYYPAVTTTAEGMQLCYSVSGPDTFARMEVAGRTDDFPEGAIEARTVVQDGQSAYTNFDPDAFSVRWGDYWGIVVDPDGETFWSIAQYSPPENPDVPADRDLYETRIAETSFSELIE